MKKETFLMSTIVVLCFKKKEKSIGLVPVSGDGYRLAFSDTGA